MAKKKNNPGMMPDLFADFGAGSDATNEQNEEKEAAPEAPETTPSADNETVPTGASVEVQEKTTVPAADDDSVSKSQSESITPLETKSIAGKNKLPAILCDDTPAELNGELIARRFLLQNGKPLLSTDNPHVPPYRLSPDDTFAVWGVVTSVIRKLL